MMKPRSLRKTLQDQTRFLFNQSWPDSWTMAVLRSQLPPGTAYSLEYPLDGGDSPWKVILPKGGSRVRHIHVLGDAVPVFADGVTCHEGQALALLMGRRPADLAWLRERVRVRTQEKEDPVPQTVPDSALPEGGAEGESPEAESRDSGGTVIMAEVPPALPSSDAPPVSGDPPLQAIPLPEEETEALPGNQDRETSIRALADWDALCRKEGDLYGEKSTGHGDGDIHFHPDNMVIQTLFHWGERPAQTPEPRGAMAAWKDGQLSVQCSTSWPHLVRRAVSEATGIPQRDIRVTSLPSHNLPDRFLLDSTLLAVWAALGAQSIEGNTRLFLSTGEDARKGTGHGETDICIQTAHDADGKLLAMRSMADLDMGSWPIASQDIMQMVLLGLCSTYRCAHQSHRVRIWRSPSPPRMPSTLLGMHGAVQAMEQHVEFLSRRIGGDSLAWRLQHLLHKGDRVPFGISSEQFVAPRLVLQSASLASDFSRTHAALELHRTRKGALLAGREALLPRRGIGIALSCQSHGMLLSRELEYRARVGLEMSDDGHLTILAPMHPGNQGMREAWLRAVEEQLGIEERNVGFSRMGTQEMDDTGPYRFSRLASVYSPLLVPACNSLRRRIRSRKLPFAVSVTWPRLKHMTWDPETFQGSPFLGRSWAAAVVELVLDPVHMVLETRSVTVSIHAGSIMHLPWAVRTVEQSVADCLSLPQLHGGVRIHETGEWTLDNGNPRIHVTFENQDDPLGAGQRLLHAGAIGDLVSGCVPAAWNNALCQITGDAPGELAEDLLHPEMLFGQPGKAAAQ